MVALRESVGSYETTESSYDPGLATRMGMVHRKMAEYRSVMELVGLASHSRTSETQEWVNRTKLTEDDRDMDNIKTREEFFDGYARDMLRSALGVHARFTQPLKRALDQRTISKASYDRWMNRYFAESEFKAREYWVQQQFPAYIERWKKAANERKQLLGHPQIKLLSDNRDVRKMQDENTFLNMHYDERVDLLARVRAALAVDSKHKGAEVFKKLHAKAQGILKTAADEGIMSRNKIGSWLERIFKSSATPEMVDRFLSHGNPTSIFALMTKWRAVRRRYDAVHLKGAPLKNPAVGMYIVPAERFLMMHYTQRLRWVEEAEQRISDATNIKEERPDFIRIRHALDLKDWEDADSLINAEAKKKDLSDVDRSRLDSMRRYLSQMRTDKKKSGSEGKEKGKPNGAQICKQISDVVATSVPSFMQDMVVRLLRSNNPNRGMHQLRWITYNNKWCRDHNFLDYERAKKGASKESAEATTQRVKDGRDSGRRQDHVLNAANSSQQHMRNNEYAKRRATLTHVDTADGGFGVNALGEWLEKEQNPKDLYWRTLCIHDNGVPMSESYHNGLFSALTLLRSLTASLEKTPFRYGGLHMPPVSLN